MLNHPKLMILIGFIMVLMGVVLPLLMVMKYLEATFFLCFLSYTVSISGVILGIIGTAVYTIPESKKPHPYGMIKFDEQEPMEKIVQ